MERCDVACHQGSGECAHEGHSEGTHVFLPRQSFTGPLDDTPVVSPALLRPHAVAPSNTGNTGNADENSKSNQRETTVTNTDNPGNA
jgi:hypothetical protein